MNLVTGATGHIGNVLVRELLAQGQPVRALVLPGEDHHPLEDLDVQIVDGDVLNPDDMRRAMKDVQKVFHLAGIISILPGKNELVQRVNVQGTRNVIQAAQECGVERVVYTSSIHAITRAPHGTTIDESLPFDPENPVGAYDRSKAQASLVVLEAVEQGLDAVIVCPTGVIGPYDFLGSEMGKLIEDCVDEKPQFYVEGAYDFVDVRDVARGLILAGDKGHCGEIYILSGERISVLDLIETVRKISGKRFIQIKIPFNLARFAAYFTPLYYRLSKTKPRFTPYSLATIASNSIISHAKAQSELGYQPRPLRESLVDTVKWFLESKRQIRHPMALDNRI